MSYKFFDSEFSFDQAIFRDEENCEDIILNMDHISGLKYNSHREELVVRYSNGMVESFLIPNLEWERAIRSLNLV